MNSSIILLVLFLISVFLTLPLPSFISKNQSNEMKMDKSSINSSIILAQKQSLRYFDIKSQLNEENFIGIWTSKNPEDAEFNIFKHSSGKISFYFYFNNSKVLNVKINIRDGDYLDKNVIIISDLPLTPRLGNENIWNASLPHSIVQFYEFSAEKTISNLQMNYSLKIINSHDDTSFIPDLRMAKATFNLESMTNEIKFNIRAELTLGEWSSQSHAIYYSLSVTIICVIKLVTLIKLIKFGNNHEPELNKISIISFSIATIMDTYLCLFHLYMALYIESFFHFFITPAFWYFILFSIFEMRFLLMLWKARYFATYDTIRDVRKGLIFFYIKLYLGMFICLALLYFFVLQNLLIILLYMLFIPQIIHTAIRRMNSGFNSVFIIGFLGIRIIYPIYFRGCPENLFSLTPSPKFLILICFLVGLQILLFFLQSKLGSRFFIPSICLPPKYKYFKDYKINLKTEIEYDDCVICMNHLHEDPSDKAQPLLNSDENVILDVKKDVVSRKIMVTPCGHRYHIPCLKRWIEVKLECPSCRKEIPPVE